MAKQKIADKDLEFLIDLDRKVHKTEFWPDEHTRSGKLRVEEYNPSIKLTEENIERVFKIAAKKDYLIVYPQWGSFGFCTVITVYDLAKKHWLCSFSHRQLPEGYGQERLIPHLKEPINRRKAKTAGINVDKAVEDCLPWFY